MTTTVAHKTTNFDLPTIDAASNSTLLHGHVDELLTLTGPRVSSDNAGADDVRPVQVSLTRAADNDPEYGESQLLYTINVLIGEGGDHGYDEVISFYDIDRAEAFVSQLSAAVQAARRDREANAAFIGSAVTR
ncbi:hypothetical protein AAFP30_22305 [Gordonia sp. CPCC 205515]|uniref:hypothetical protein n=1 Tax=Gordonia sp. CPCC 205515 TaxID=3140791 RepID=UPI003AF3F1FD